jgi:hypothetical protein
MPPAQKIPWKIQKKISKTQFLENFILDINI